MRGDDGRRRERCDAAEFDGHREWRRRGDVGCGGVRAAYDAPDDFSGFRWFSAPLRLVGGPPRRARSRRRSGAVGDVDGPLPRLGRRVARRRAVGGDGTDRGVGLGAGRRCPNDRRRRARAVGRGGGRRAAIHRHQHQRRQRGRGGQHLRRRLRRAVARRRGGRPRDGSLRPVRAGHRADGSPRCAGRSADRHRRGAGREVARHQHPLRAPAGEAHRRGEPGGDPSASAGRGAARRRGGAARSQLDRVRGLPHVAHDVRLRGPGSSVHGGGGHEPAPGRGQVVGGREPGRRGGAVGAQGGAGRRRSASPAGASPVRDRQPRRPVVAAHRRGVAAGVRAACRPRPQRGPADRRPAATRSRRVADRRAAAPGDWSRWRMPPIWW